LGYKRNTLLAFSLTFISIWWWKESFCGWMLFLPWQSSI
jgi:hypothetical protein